MTEPSMGPYRRADDARIADLKQQVSKVANDVSSIRDMLISEPEASPMGRALIQRAVDNRRMIDGLRADLDPIEDWYQQMRGVWRVLPATALVLSIVGAILALAAYLKP